MNLCSQSILLFVIFAEIFAGGKSSFLFDSVIIINKCSFHGMERMCNIISINGTDSSPFFAVDLDLIFRLIHFWLSFLWMFSLQSWKPKTKLTNFKRKFCLRPWTKPKLCSVWMYYNCLNHHDLNPRFHKFLTSCISWFLQK